METDASRVLPEFGEVEISSLPDGTTFEDIKSLQSLYREHCEVSPIYIFLNGALVKWDMSLPMAGLLELDDL